MSEWFVVHEIELWALFSVCIAVIVGAAIGIERELAEKPAGLRTHMLVAGSSALFVGLGEPLIAYWSERARLDSEGSLTALRVDPTRLLEALVTGLAFLGAGTILRKDAGTGVSGLTTAASIFFTGIVGGSIAVGEYVLAIGSAIVLLVTLRVVGRFEARLH